jgi:hypothetical protein
MTSDDPEGPPLSPEEEALVRKTIERGLERYKGIAPPEVLKLMRQVGTDGLRTHPLTRALVARLARKPAVPDRSGDLPAGGDGKAEPGAARSSGSGGTEGA